MPRKKIEEDEGVKPEKTEVAEEPLKETPRDESMAGVEVLVENAMTETKVFPQIRAGVCEFHGTPYGIVDPNTLKGRCRHECKTDPLCPHSRSGCESDSRTWRYANGVGYCKHEHHYQGVPIRCTYCPADVNVREMLKTRTLSVFQSPSDARRFVIVCSDYRCRQKHLQRFNQKVI